MSPRAWASAPCSGDGRRSQPTLPTITIRRKKERESVLRTLFCLLRKKYIWSISQQTWSPFHNFCTKISMRKPYGIYKQSFKRKSCGWNAGCFVIVAKLTFGPILVLIWAGTTRRFFRKSWCRDLGRGEKRTKFYCGKLPRDVPGPGFFKMCGVDSCIFYSLRQQKAFHSHISLHFAKVSGTF